MSKPPEALRLAKYLELEWVTGDCLNAANELRRLSAVEIDRDRLHAANVELMQELENIAKANPLNWDAPLNDTASFQAWAQSRARAAIAKHGATS